MGMGIFAMPYVGRPGTREALEPETSTGITTTIRHPTSGSYKGLDAKAALIQNKSQNEAQFTIDGTAPTASSGTDVGFVLSHDESFLITGKEAVKNFLAIDRSAGSKSKIEVVCFF